MGVVYSTNEDAQKNNIVYKLNGVYSMFFKSSLIGSFDYTKHKLTLFNSLNCEKYDKNMYPLTCHNVNYSSKDSSIEYAFFYGKFDEKRCFSMKVFPIQQYFTIEFNYTIDNDTTVINPIIMKRSSINIKGRKFSKLEKYKYDVFIKDILIANFDWPRRKFKIFESVNCGDPEKILYECHDLKYAPYESNSEKGLFYGRIDKKRLFSIKIYPEFTDRYNAKLSYQHSYDTTQFILTMKIAEIIGFSQLSKDVYDIYRGEQLFAKFNWKKREFELLKSIEFYNDDANQLKCNNIIYSHYKSYNKRALFWGSFDEKRDFRIIVRKYNNFSDDGYIKQDITDNDYIAEIKFSKMYRSIRFTHLVMKPKGKID